MHRPAELSVFKGKETRRGGACLQKQKSLTNLSFTSESEKRPNVRKSNWFGNAARSQRESHFEGRNPLSRFLSRSVQSLYHTSSSGAWNLETLLPTGGKAGGKRPEGWSAQKDFDGDSDEGSRYEDDLGCSKPNSSSKSWTEDEEESCLREGTAHLDEDVILTMLGDLEQVLYTDILGRDWGKPGADIESERILTEVKNRNKTQDEGQSSIGDEEVKRSPVLFLAARLA
ncbi:neuron navigator 1-like [Phascolarctos cinereus]